MLEEYEFDIKYIPGKQNVTADALSRISITSDELKTIDTQIEETINVITRSKSETAHHQGPKWRTAFIILKRRSISSGLKVIAQSEFDKLL